MLFAKLVAKLFLELLNFFVVVSFEVGQLGTFLTQLELKAFGVYLLFLEL